MPNGCFASRLVLSCLGGWLLLGGNCGRSAESKGTGPDFDRDIRPILSENCYACHGPDEGKRKAKLRLDRKEEAFKTLPNGEIAVVPGQPEASKLVERISSIDPDEVMPPVKTGKKLTPSQVELLRRWIASGARWESHWAFLAPKRAVLPEVQHPSWSGNEIDRFVLARLEGEGLTPSEAADQTTLLRRVTLDLTGLPPTLAEIDAFVADTGPAAYEKVVDRLLRSPRYGEHMAHYWLDAVRYGDSHGYHIDYTRDIWPYREWVIRAFNENMPFDQFTVEQLAGDLLPNATVQQRIASGYNRCRMSSNEGGAIEEEFLAKAMFDRAETTATTWLGLTFTCARCHNHKFDPLSQREYYAFAAFFNSFDEPVFDSNVRNTDPYLKLPTLEQTQRQEWLRTQIRKAQDQLEAKARQLEPAEREWAAQWHQRIGKGWTPVALQAAGGGASNLVSELASDGSWPLPNPGEDKPADFEVLGKLACGALAAIQVELFLDAVNGTGQVAGALSLAEVDAEILAPGGKAVSQKLKFVEAAADAFEPEHGPEKVIDGNLETSWTVAAGSSAEAHRLVLRLAQLVNVTNDTSLRLLLRFANAKRPSLVGRVRLAVAQNEALVQLFSSPEPWHVIGPFKNSGLRDGLDTVYEPEQQIELDKTYPGAFESIAWESKPEFDEGRPHALVYDVYSQKGNGVFYLYRTLKLPAAAKACLSLRADEVFKVWLNGRLIAARSSPEKPGDGVLKTDVQLQAGENRVLLKVVNYEDRLSYFTYHLDFEDVERLPCELAGVLAASAHPEGGLAARLSDYFGRRHSQDYKGLFDSLEAWRYEDKAIEKAIATTLVSKELATPRETYVLGRGEYDKKAEKVSCNVPSILPALLPNQPTNRLGLARWLTSPGHPLTARVVVNRLWEQCFGVGLVKTVEDFGIQGERPSHPELLDWLACELVESGWDLKHLERLLVLSSTYRQSSRSTPALSARDPENRLLARGPRFRVDAEVVRDTALSVSGLLVEQLGGPSAKPFEPPGLWEAVSHDNRQRYVPDCDEREYRRSVYTFWKRQSPPPNMLIFDAPTRESCLVRRTRTTTPLQALVLLNDPQFVEASRALAQRILLESGRQTEERVQRGFRLATARVPAPEETRILCRMLERETARFQNEPEAAKSLLEVGNFRARPELDPRELAAWTTVASVMLNLDETVTKN